MYLLLVPREDGEGDHANMQVFLQHMLGMLPVLGVHAFEQPPQAPAALNVYH